MVIFALSACGQQSAGLSSTATPDITLDEVETALTEQGLALEEADLPNTNVFIQELNGVSPQVYFIEGNTLSIYVFPTEDAGEKGMGDFEEKTAAAELEIHKTFTNKNVLVFYTEGSEEVNSELSTAISNLE